MQAAVPRRIVILGGGTAGWMTACLLADRWAEKGTVITLVESSEIGIIGVGEGSTPQLKEFFSKLGIDESLWMPACNATYKTGICFRGWSSRAGFDHYFHPFATGIDVHTAPAFFFHTQARRTGRDVWAHPDRFFLPTYLANHRLAPIANDNFPFSISYGYHFDAQLVGAFLRDYAVQKLGVTRLERTISNAIIEGEGQIVALRTTDNELIEGDFFIDCSGFRSALIGETLREPFISFRENLFNDAAIAFPTPSDPAAIQPCTQSTALSNGWAWAIPLRNRTGNGYVYASDFMTAEAAEIELRRHLGLLDSDVTARRLKMRVGRMARSWVSNCLAVGLAQGFIEPLEATALHVVQTSVEMFADTVEGQGVSAQTITNYNDAIAARYEGIRDYIVAHYRLNTCGSSEYWRANAANEKLSTSLKQLMSCWFTGGDLVAEIARQNIVGFYGPLSWHCLFAGYGTYPEDSKLRSPEPQLPLRNMTEVDDFISRCAQNFRPHVEWMALK